MQFSKRLMGLALAVTAIVGATPVLAQGTVRGEYGDWQMSCDTPPGASFEQCAIIQNVMAEDQPNVGLSVIVLRTADREARLLRVLAPLGVL
ncbi:MAG: invasion associated locus B family protein, partial [Hyphomicrobiales bacterium]